MKQSLPGKGQAGSKKRLLIPVLLFLITIPSLRTHAQDDPFARLKRIAASEDTLKKTLPSKTITTNDPLWRTKTKAPIPFRPITAKDLNRDNIPPDEILTLDNGVKMTASQYFARVNQIQREANKHGYSLLDKEVFRSETVTPSSTLDGKAASTPPLSGPLKTKSQQDAFMNPQVKADNMILKPLGDYTAAEKQKVLSGKFKDFSGPGLKVQGMAVAPAIFERAVRANTPLKTIDENSRKDYSFGDPGTFQAGITASLRRVAKIFGQGSKKTEFTITGNGKIYGAVLGHSFNVVNSTAVAYSPADSSKKMSLKLVVNLAGFDVLNTTYEYDARKVLSGEKSKPFEYGKSISVPLIWGVSLTGKVGVKGSVGYSYNVELDRAFLKAQFKPMADIEGFLEVGLSAPLDIASIGVRAELTFLQGFADLSAWFGIYNANFRQIVLGYGYDLSYFVEILKGEIKLVWRVGCVTWPWEYCLLKGEHTFFKWSGKKITGTYADGRYLFNIYSGAVAERADDLWIK